MANPDEIDIDEDDDDDDEGKIIEKRMVYSQMLTLVFEHHITVQTCSIETLELVYRLTIQKYYDEEGFSSFFSDLPQQRDVPSAVYSGLK